MTGGLWESQEVFRGAEGPASRAVLSWALALVALVPSMMLLGGSLRPKTCWLRSMVHAVARPCWAAPLVAALVALLISGALAARHPPTAYIHDEFTYLMQADTFAHGRVSNPVPPEWRHFETFHILLQPTYSAKYPPGQALTLALGQILFDAPIAGVWLAFAAACAAVAWAARAWLGPRWGLVAGLLAALHPSIHMFKPFTWTQSYWGGGLAFLGGALLMGAWRRLDRHVAVSSGLAFGAGLSILLLTRPWEGVVATLPIAAGLLARQFDGSHALKPFFLRFALPVAALLLLTAAGVARVNKAVTGSATTMPYMEYEKQYAAAPIFIFQEAPPARWNEHPGITSYHGGWSRGIYEKQRSLKGFLAVFAFKCFLLFNFYPGAYLGLIPGFFMLLRSHRFGRISLVVVFGLIATFCTCWTQPHYVAPAAGAFFLFATACARRLACCLKNRRAALWMAATGLLSSPVLLMFGGLILPSRSRPAWADERVRIIQELEARPGNHLVFVKYGPLHNINFEWVYNSADLTSQRIIWARTRDEEKDARLVQAFPGREVWEIEPDRGVPQMKRVEGEGK
ncbi:MAG: hypothetical protein FD180_1331 [Planctomycetota bacterium]|nr:MAG: hypothetical protein FD180_1331 [Planctomycetota bacterium]